MTLSDLLAGGPGHDGYTYNADVYCVECGQLHIHRLWAAGQLTSELAQQDSATCPQPIFFGKSDTDSHCADCGEYLYGGILPDEEPTQHMVVVGNIGTVYSGTDRAEAERAFLNYQEQSDTCPGARCYGESVSWLVNDEVLREHSAFEGSDDEYLSR